MKLRNFVAALMCLALVAASAVTALAAPEDGNYIDDIYDWVSSTVSDVIDDISNGDSSDGGESGYDTPDDTSSNDTSHEPETEYYPEPETEIAPEPEPEPETYADSSSESGNWYDWFSVSQAETEPKTDAVEENIDDSSKPGTTEYVGYGLLMWIVIIVGGIITIGILTNTHIRKKS